MWSFRRLVAELELAADDRNARVADAQNTALIARFVLSRGRRRAIHRRSQPPMIVPVEMLTGGDAGARSNARNEPRCPGYGSPALDCHEGTSLFGGPSLVTLDGAAPDWS